MDGTLNDNLLPSDSPIAQNTGALPAFNFFQSNERHSVTASRIKDFDFSAGVSGTISVGGTLNQNAQILIYNPANNELAEVDNNGISLFGTTSLQYYDTNLGSFIASFGPMTGTAFIQTQSGIPLTIVAGGGSGTVLISGRIDATSGTFGSLNVASGTITTIKATTGTINTFSGTYASPVLTGTSTYSPNASTAALLTNQFDIQTKVGSAVLVANIGGTNFFFSSSGTF